jgi:hypothetical protein
MTDQQLVSQDVFDEAFDKIGLDGVLRMLQMATGLLTTPGLPVAQRWSAQIAALPESARNEPAIADVMAAVGDLLAKVDFVSDEFTRSRDESARAGRRQFWLGLAYGAAIGLPVGLLTNFVWALIAG